MRKWNPESGKGSGYCRLLTQKCTGKQPWTKLHDPAYRCSKCHKKDKKTGIFTKPTYLPNTEIGCNYRGKKKSSAKHFERYHGTTNNHTKDWVKDNPHSSFKSKINNTSKSKMKKVSFGQNSVKTLRYGFKYQTSDYPIPKYPCTDYQTKTNRGNNSLSADELQQLIDYRRKKEESRLFSKYEKLQKYGFPLQFLHPFKDIFDTTLNNANILPDNNELMIDQMIII